MWLTRRQCLVIAAALAGPAAAGPEAGEGAAERLRRLPAVPPLALRGFDPVSYFLPGGPASGNPAYEMAWDGRTWRFAKAANRDAFRRDPESYGPRLGGFDAVGVAEGRLVDADPLVFAILDSRLYLFRNAGRRAEALAEPDLARRAEARWPSLRPLMDAPR
ncbi:YHS domain-containing (seleno)protein [Methylobacterium durans]|uniref:YHS domain-containing (seleno)protein n=1 Tax=Methylobacterium durans TaxID=2202825 RepID=UPI002AFE1322|nr:YHS domain-containing (seleno)protein [Methylobacterium durans]MEA1832205.1 YHS domain-containing (seleno)protein [Methylobacterium durans]